MSDLPDFPTDRTEDDVGAPPSRVGRYIAIGVGLILLLVVLHLTGVVGPA